MKKTISLIVLIVVFCGYVHGQGTWTLLPYKCNEYIWSIHFSDNDHGYITCAKHKIYKTSDGGQNWIDVSPSFILDTNYHYKNICTLDSMTAFAGSVFGFMIRTYDGGLTWDSVPVPFPVVSGVYFMNDSIGFLDGWGLSKTTDRGHSWTFIDSLWTSPSMQFVDDSTGYIGGFGGNIYKTVDQGLTWTIHNTNMSAFTNRIYFFNATHGIAVDGYGHWAITYDGAQSWASWSFETSFELVGLHFVNDSLGFTIYSNTGGTFKTSYDAGITWTTTYTGNCSGMTDMYFPSKCVGYMCGMGGKILKYTDNNCLNPFEISSPSKALSNISVFPNPLSEKLTFTSNQNEESEIIIYDIFSRKILQQKFTNSISINTEHFSKGVYIYQLMIQNKVEGSGKVIKD